VIEPASLRERVRSELVNALRQYELEAASTPTVTKPKPKPKPGRSGR
jgi:hypothetical protein